MTAETPPYPLPLRSPADTEGEIQRVLSKLEASGHLNTILRLLANSPNGFRPFVWMSNALLTQARLPAEVREIVILSMAARNGTAYEWAEHVSFAQRAGVPASKVDALAFDDADLSEVLTSQEHLAVRVAGSLLDGSGLDPETWQACVSAWGPEGALDLVFTVGWWGGFVPVVIGALGLTAEAVDPPPAPQ